MSYLGKVDMNDADIKHYSLTGSTATTVDIGWVPPSEQSLRVTINGVVQQGGTFSLSGSNLTLGGALVATDDLEVVGIQSVGNLITPADNSVSTAKLADDSVTLAKMAGLARGKIIVGDASGNPSALTVGASTQILTSDGTDAAWAAAPAGGIQASEMIGYKQRPVFERTSATEMTLHGNFAYQHMGTTTQIVSGSNVVFTRSDTSGTQQWNYLYLDDSAIVTAGNATITASQLISSPTAPTLNVAKGGFYNGNDRCIFAWLQDASNNIDNMSRLSHVGGGVEAVRISTQWQFYNASGGSYGTGWHTYTPSAVYLPYPRGTAGLCIGVVLHLGGGHTSMVVGQDAQNWDMFHAESSDFYSIAGIDSNGKFNIRTTYDHSSYTYLFHTKGWVMSPLL